MQDKLTIETVNTYLTDKNQAVSLLNKLDFMDTITEDDYNKFIITDYYEDRLDLIAKDLIGNQDFYIFIMWLNNLDDFKDNIANEVIGTGNGSIKSFDSIELDFFPVKESTIEIKFIISGIEYTVTDDGNGNFTDSKISLGTIDYSHGLLYLEFISAIDNLTNVTVSYEKNTQNLKAGQELLIPTYNFIHQYYSDTKKERGL